MPTRYRIAIVALGLFVVAGASLSLFTIPRLDPVRGHPIRAVLGAGVAIAIGLQMAVGGYRGRAPAWLVKLLLGNRDRD